MQVLELCVHLCARAHAMIVGEKAC
eukprot:COSAG03_NODE_27467_length_253_cov_0.655844_1_plen_24_part_01